MAGIDPGQFAILAVSSSWAATSDPLMSAYVEVHRQGRVATLTLNRPERRNAIASQQDCDELVAALAGLQADESLGCLLLTGAGSAFCAGGDLKAMQAGGGIGARDTPEATRRNYRDGVQQVIRALWECELPMVAAVNGAAIGLGCDLAACCDLRLAGRSARFASSFIQIGLVPGDGGAWSLPREIGLPAASELMLTGRTVTADTALSIGLVSRVVDDATLMDEALQLAEEIAAQPLKTLRLTKRLLREGQQLPLSAVLELSAAFQALAHQTADHQEAVAAFIDKRPPVFTGH